MGDSTIKICQYDGNADPDPESDDEEQGPLENIQASKCGWIRIKTNEYPKGISFWSDPDRPPEHIIALEGAPPMGEPPKHMDTVKRTSHHNAGSMRVTKS